MQSPWSRRQVLRLAVALSGAAGVGGCGFQPVYMPTASGKPGPAERQMAAIRVGVIANRPGQLLRQALQQRFDGAGGAVTPRYSLAVNYSIAGEGVAIRPDSTATHIRLIGHADWTLSSLSPGHLRVTSGSARAFEGIDLLDTQYFAADLETQAAHRRLANQIASQIAMELAVFFRRRAGPGHPT